MNREAIQERNYQQHCKIGRCEGFLEINAELVDLPLGLMYLLERIYEKLAERTKLKV